MTAAPELVLPVPPHVNGRSTRIIQLDLPTLANSSLLSPFAKMVLAAFKVSYRQPYIAPDFPRLESNEQILHELKPDVIIFLLTPVDDPETVLASVAAHPYHATSPEELKQMHPFALKWLVQPSEEDPQMPRWALKQLCVSPEAQRNGLAGWLLNLADSVIRQVVTQQKKDPNVQDVTEACDGAKMLLSTTKELNGTFYAKRGWRITGERMAAPGYMGSEGGFTIVLMERNISL